jgi:hypothetical protein
LRTAHRCGSTYRTSIRTATGDLFYNGAGDILKDVKKDESVLV